MLKPPAVSDSYTRTAGLLLAGGMGNRLGGVRKADLVVGGQRLFDLACGNLCAQTHQVIAAMGAAEPASASGNEQVNRVADPGHGPAAAMLHVAGLLPKLASEAEFLLVVPCDAPFMPLDFADMALGLLEGRDAVVGQFGDRLYPTHSLWRISTLARLADKFSASDGPAIFALLDRADFAPLPYKATNGFNPFFNINVSADLVAANREMAVQRKASFS